MDCWSKGLGLVSVIRLFDLPALNQSFVYALECRQTGHAFVNYSECQEPGAEVREHRSIAVSQRISFSIPVVCDAKRVSALVPRNLPSTNGGLREVRERLVFSLSMWVNSISTYQDAAYLNLR